MQCGNCTGIPGTHAEAVVGAPAVSPAVSAAQSRGKAKHFCLIVIRPRYRLSAVTTNNRVAPNLRREHLIVPSGCHVPDRAVRGEAQSLTYAR